MVATVSYNYMTTTNAPGTFNSASSGGVQGMYIDDPATRYQLQGGVLASTETIPMWGGIGINVTTAPNAGYTNPTSGVINSGTSSLGGLVTRATNLTAGAAGQLIGFSTFNQAYAMVNNPASPVPLAGSYMQVNYFQLGSNARMYLACSSALSGLEGGSIAQQVSWDFVNQQLQPYTPNIAATNGTSAATYNSTTGALVITISSAPFGAGATTQYNGVNITTSNITGTGAGVPSLNGTFPITGIATSGTVITVQAPTGLTASGLSNGTILVIGGALPVHVEDVLIGLSMTVVYNSTTNVATWNYTGNVAIVRL